MKLIHVAPKLVVDLSAVPLSDLATALHYIDMGGFQIVNVRDPMFDQDAVTKKYFTDNKYTDAEVNAIVAIHTAIASAHHTNHEAAQTETARFKGIEVERTGGAIGLIDGCTINEYARMNLTTYSTGTNQCPILILNRSNSGSKTKVTTVNGQMLGAFMFYGVHSGNDWAGAAGIQIFQDGNAGTVNVPSKFHFYVYDELNVPHYGFTIDKRGWTHYNSGGVKATSPHDINFDRIRIKVSKTPATAGATGLAGEICWDANYIYTCVATNTWKRTPISTW